MGSWFGATLEHVLRRPIRVVWILGIAREIRNRIMDERNRDRLAAPRLPLLPP